MALSEPGGCITLVGGVGQLYQGDLDLGRLAAEQLSGSDLGPRVSVEELHYGAVAVAQRIQEFAPGTLILIGAEHRGRPPGSLERRRVEPFRLDDRLAQGAIVDAAAGYVSIDLVLDVAGALGVLPGRTITFEVEPVSVTPGMPLSAPAAEGLVELIALTRREVGRQPLFELSDRLGLLLEDSDRLEPTPALDAIRDLLGCVRQLDQRGTWGDAFRRRDRLRRAIAEGRTGLGMDALDWSLWWALIEELDRLEALEAVS